MSYKAIYRTYRPKSFADVVGQDAIVQTLQHAIKSNKIAHAYLFCGPAGTGKTSVAKLLAKAINCTNTDGDIPCNHCESCMACDNEQNGDIIEIDAASNNGVDQIRDIIDQVKYPPMNSKYKVYIIDEVHMLSSGAFNALLKTLEEPPNYVVFILATTEPHKVIPTIISRCQRYDFRKVDDIDMHKRLDYILEKENIQVDADALEAIVSLAGGGVRSCLSILDQCVAYTSGKVTLDTVNDVYGLTSKETKLSLIEAMKAKDVATTMTLIDQLNQRGVDFKRLILDLLLIYKEAVAYLYTNDMELVSICSREQIQQLTYRMMAKQFLDSIDIWLKTNNDLRFGNDVVSYFEIACLKNMDVFDTNHSLATQQAPSPVIATPSQPTVYPPTGAIKQMEQPVNQSEEPTNVSRETLQDTSSNVQPPVVEQQPQALEVVTPSQPVEQPVVNQPVINETQSYDDNYLFGLLVQAQRGCKSEDEQHFQHLNEYRIDLKSGKLIALLQQCGVYASGEKFLIVDSMYDDIIQQINTIDINYELQSLYQAAFNVGKKIVAIDRNRGITLREQFRQLAQNKQLPKPVEVVLADKADVVNPIEQQLKDVFKDKLIIKE